MPLSDDPTIRFRQQANTRVSDVIFALQRLAKLASLAWLSAQRDDCQAVIAAVENEWRKTRAAIETGVSGSAELVFPDVADADADAPEPARTAEPVAPAGPATPGIDPGNPTPFGG